MKAEERHRLKTNSLSAALDNFWRGLWDGSNSTTLYVGGFILLLGVGAVVALTVYSSIANDSRSKLWVALGNATNLDDMEPAEKMVPAKQVEYVTGTLGKLAKDNPGSIAARVAQFEEARILFHEGLDKLGTALNGTDPEARATLEKAGKLYARLADETGHQPILQQEALACAAKARESLGDLEGARPFYTRLATARPESELTKQAKAFLEGLDNADTKAQVTALYDKVKADLEKNTPAPK